MAESFAPEAIAQRTRGEASLQPMDRSDQDDALRLTIEAARLLQDRHCENIVAFDVAGLSPVTDYVVIASGTSDRQVRSVGHEVATLAKSKGFPRLGSDRDEDYRWFVVDFGAVMVHLFEPVTRGHYDLEMLWGDAKRVKWRRPPQSPDHTAPTPDPASRG